MAPPRRPSRVLQRAIAEVPSKHFVNCGHCILRLIEFVEIQNREGARRLTTTVFKVCARCACKWCRTSVRALSAVAMYGKRLSHRTQLDSYGVQELSGGAGILTRRYIAR